MTNALAYYMVESLKSFKFEAPNQFFVDPEFKKFSGDFFSRECCELLKTELKYISCCDISFYL